MPAEERLAFARKSAAADDHGGEAVLSADFHVYAVEQTMLMDDVRADEP